MHSDKRGWQTYDCGCVKSRPKHSRKYGCRWKVYKSKNYIITKCLDCNKSYYYQLIDSNVRLSKREKRKQNNGVENNG